MACINRTDQRKRATKIAELKAFVESKLKFRSERNLVKDDISVYSFTDEQVRKGGLAFCVNFRCIASSSSTIALGFQIFCCKGLMKYLDVS